MGASIFRSILSENTLSSVSGGSYTGPCVQYTVVKGDNLARIARRYSTTVNILVELNGIKNPSRIYIGQVLLIPALLQA